MKQATIIKVISNQYTLYCEGNVYEALAMGKVRLDKKPVVGDRVDFEKLNDKYVIQKILKRTNELKRPLIANVDQAIIVMSALDPDFSTTLIDRLIFMISYNDIEPIICVTKMDLVNDHKKIDQYINDYKKSGYRVYTSGTDFDTKDIEEVLTGKISVLTGQSGTGKSTLINRIDNTMELKTQQTSKALGRGKHTTRHCEIYEIAGGWLADTPGFSSLDFSGVDEKILANKIIDFKPYLGKCKFNNCMHLNEPDCAIKQAVEDGEIIKYRYEHYKSIVEYIKQNNNNY